MTTSEASRRGRSNRYNGRRFQSDVAQWLRHEGFPHAESAAGNGWRTLDYTSPDPLDITGTPGLVWSLKRVTEASEEQHQRWLRDAHDIAVEHGCVGVLVAKRHGRSDIGSSFAYRLLPMPYVSMPMLAVRTDLWSMTRLLRAEGYGTPVDGEDDP